MRLTNARIALLHFTIAFAATVAVFCVACYPAPSEDVTLALTQRYAPVFRDAGFGDRLPMLRGVRLVVPESSDGAAWPEEREGLSELFDDARDACASHVGERVLRVASLDSPYVCHGFGHILHSDRLGADGGCVGLGDDGVTDHDFFAAVELDRKCREAAP